MMSFNKSCCLRLLKSETSRSITFVSVDAADGSRGSIAVIAAAAAATYYYITSLDIG